MEDTPLYKKWLLVHTCTAPLRRVLTTSLTADIICGPLEKHRCVPEYRDKIRYMITFLIGD